jgi:glycosyltransferase involved in cell wall biosynthesis
MKIAYLTADFGVPVPGTKGASVHVQEMVHALREDGHDVAVLTPARTAGRSSAPVHDIPLNETAQQLIDELKHEDIAAGNRLAKDLRNLFYAMTFPEQATFVLDEFQPDFVYERYSLFGFGGAELARRFAVPHFLEVNAPLVDEQRRMRGLSLPRVAEMVESRVFDSASHIFVVSQSLREYVAGRGISTDRITVLPNAADPDRFAPPDGPSSLRRRLGWEDRFVVGFVGSMKSWHGVDTLVAALRMLADRDPRYCLLLVGDGPERESLGRGVTELGLTEQVHMTGAVPHEAVPDCIAAMDVAVAPYAGDADGYFSPVKLFEYLAMARPTVAAAVGQVADIIEQGCTGWLYPPGDSARLAGVIQELSLDSELARRVGRAGRELVLGRYTWAANARRVIDVAERIGAGSVQPATMIGTRMH